MSRVSEASSNRSFLIVVYGLLGSAALTLVLVAIGLIRQASIPGQRQSLEYRTLLAAVDEIITLGEGQEVLHFVAAEHTVSGQRVVVDTLVIDPMHSIPSLGRGGYLYDEVQRYNTFQRERLSLAMENFAGAGRLEFERLEPYNPSLFRPYRQAGGEVGVTRTAAAWSRRVQSPFGDRWSGDVRTGDSEVSWSLYSQSASVPLDRATRLSRSVNGRRRSCEFEPRGDDALAFCLSEARTPQLTLRGVGTEEGPNRVVSGWSAIEVDGVRVRSGDSVDIEGGSILNIAPLGPVVFGRQRSGVLSSQQWINGRMRRRGLPVPPLDIVATLGRGPIDPAAPPDMGSDLLLSVNEQATLALNEQLDAFVRVLPIPLEFGTVVVARVTDGAIVAMAEVGTRSEPGRSRLLERVVPGSAVKPMLAAAVLSQRPELGSLTIPARSGLVRRVGDAPAIPANQAFRTALNCGMPSGGRVDLRAFLRCSNNEYAAELLLLGATTPGASEDPLRQAGSTSEHGASSRFEGRTVSRGTLLRSAFTEGMSDLFGVSTDPTITDATNRSGSAWSGLAFADGTLARVPFEALPDASRPSLLGTADSERTDLGLLYRYAFGAWENRWNLFDLTGAFGRVVTDRRLTLTLSSTPPASANTPLALSEFDWYSDFLAGLAGVGRDGTARGLAAKWRSAGLPGTVFAKTGTLAEGEARRGSGLFIKSLLFAVGETEDGPTTPLQCGLVGSVYLSFKHGPARGSLPSYQVDFAERRLARFLADHWEEFGACPEPLGTVARTMGTG